MAKRDCYEVLGVARTASLDEIKKAYRKAALQFHPDRNPGDKASEEKFKEATEAYSLLSDSDSRVKYDQFGWAAFEQGAGSGFGGFHADFSEFEDIFGDLFSSFFGGSFGGSSSRRTRGRSGRDLRYDLEIEFIEAIRGCEREIKITKRVHCEQCSGSGAAEGSSAETCQQCRGNGQVAIQQGFFTVTRTCHVCSGSGKVIKKPCKACAGAGLKPKESVVQVKIPAGINDGQRLKLRGEGESGQLGGPAGDLFVHIAVSEHPFFKRQDSEIVCEMPISYAVAVLGGEIEVPTVDGDVNLKIPAGTDSGKVFRLKGKGVQSIGASRRGDQHVQIYVRVPKKISEKQKAILEKLHEFEKEDSAAESRGFFERVREMFN